jgi:regulatory protein
MFKRKPRNPHAPPLTPDEALAKLEHFCAYRERCSSEVRDRIKELNLPKDLGAQLYEVLQSDRFFDDARFAENFVRGKFRGNHWGRVRIRMELKMRHLEEPVIEEALAQIDETAYVEMIQTMLQKKYQQWHDDPQGRQKAAAAVIRSGFEPSIVFGLLGRLSKKDYDGDEEEIDVAEG